VLKNIGQKMNYSFLEKIKTDIKPGLFIKTNKDPLKQQVNTVSAGFVLSPVG